jgi:hypothetical protein
MESLSRSRGLATVALRDSAKVLEEYNVIGQTKFAPIALRMNATFKMLQSAKKRIA